MPVPAPVTAPAFVVLRAASSTALVPIAEGCMRPPRLQPTVNRGREGPLGARRLGKGRLHSTAEAQSARNEWCGLHCASPRLLCVVSCVVLCASRCVRPSASARCPSVAARKGPDAPLCAGRSCALATFAPVLCAEGACAVVRLLSRALALSSPFPVVLSARCSPWLATAGALRAPGTEREGAREGQKRNTMD
jgi:hypothetical protein